MDLVKICRTGHRAFQRPFPPYTPTTSPHSTPTIYTREELTHSLSQI